MLRYWQIISIGIQSTLSYRVNFFCRAVFNFIPLTATIVLWQAVYSGAGATVAGYTLQQMVSYYLLVCLVDTLTAITEDDWQIATDIKDGQISQFLTKPLNYLPYRLCLFFSGRLIYTLAAALPVLVFFLAQREYFPAPASFSASMFFLISLTMSALIQFFLSFTVAMLAFWVVEISTFVFILLAFERMASGHMFPLDILPASLHQVLMMTPFPYLVFFPVSVYTGKTAGAELVQGLVVQFCWVVAAWWVAKAVWKRGLKTYAAVGG